MRRWIDRSLWPDRRARGRLCGHRRHPLWHDEDQQMDRFGRGGINQMSQGPLATPARQPVAAEPRSCLFQLSDLAAGPLEIMVVPVPGRYSSLSIFDAATDVAFVRNDVEAGGKTLSNHRRARRAGGAAGRRGGARRHDRGIALIWVCC